MQLIVIGDTRDDSMWLEAALEASGIEDDEMTKWLDDATDVGPLVPFLTENEGIKTRTFMYEIYDRGLIFTILKGMWVELLGDMVGHIRGGYRFWAKVNDEEWVELSLDGDVV